MSGNFLKFKRKLQIIRIVKSLLAGAASGSFASGIALILSKLAIVGFAPIISLPIGFGVGLLTGAIVYFALKTSDKVLARELDARFSLHEKVQTMIAFEGESGDLYDLQREDTESTLSTVRAKDYKPKKLWICFVALAVGAALLLSGFVVENRRNYVPPEVVVPFAISDMQIAGIEELVRYVEDSEMEAPYKEEIISELGDLLTALKAATTEPEMQAALAESMAIILAVTSDASSMTEILDELWDTGDEYIKTLAKVLNTSDWTEPDWGDYAEKYSEFCAMLIGDSSAEAEPAEADAEGEGTDGSETVPPTEEELKSGLAWILESASMKIDLALSGSGIAEDDPLYASVYRFTHAEHAADEAEGFLGIAKIAESAETMSYAVLLSELNALLDGMTDELYGVISQQKINTNVGEYTMRKLATLFGVPLPEFERPEFVKNGEGSGGSEDQDDEDGPSDGGIGEGSVYGSTDLVLDPLTGNYVEYGTLLDKYYAVMYEKLKNGSYTEEQKKAIQNYFALLYGGIEKEEGN